MTSAFFGNEIFGRCEAFPKTKSSRRRPHDPRARPRTFESVIKNSKEGYYLALRQTQATIRSTRPDWQAWLLFFMWALQQQKRRLAVKIEREERALAELPQLAIMILDHARQHGRVTNRDMVREHGASPNTLKATFGSLVEKGMLARHGGGRSIWYGLPMGTDEQKGGTGY